MPLSIFITVTGTFFIGGGIILMLWLVFTGFRLAKRKDNKINKMFPQSENEPKPFFTYRRTKQKDGNISPPPFDLKTDPETNFFE